MTYVDKAAGRIVVTGSITTTSVYRNAAQSIPSGSATAVTFDTTDFSSAVSPTVSGATIVSRYSGLHRLTFRAGLAPSAAAANTRLRLAIRVNGTEITEGVTPFASTAAITTQCEIVANLTVGDVVTATIMQDTGSSQNTQTSAIARPLLQAEYMC